MSMLVGGVFSILGNKYVAPDPVEHLYTSGSGTDTIPNNATAVTIEVWGGGAAGGVGYSSVGGQGGGSGGYCKTILTLTSGDWGDTISYTVGAGGSNTGPDWGNNSTVSSGTYTITTMTGGYGEVGSGITTSANDGTGGTATGGNDTNTNGNDGSFWSGSSGGAGGSAIFGDTTSAGGGGAGGNAPTGASVSGSDGKVRFYYTFY